MDKKKSYFSLPVMLSCVVAVVAVMYLMPYLPAIGGSSEPTN